MEGEAKNTALTNAIEHLETALKLLDECQAPAAAAFVAHAIDLLGAADT